MLPLIEGKAEGWKDRYLFTHIARWETGTEPNTQQHINYGVRNQQYRFVGPRGGRTAGGEKAGALYDITKDPLQKTNVISEHPEVAAEMRAAYDAFWKEARPFMVNETAPMSPTKPYHELYRKQAADGGIPEWKPPTL